MDFWTPARFQAITNGQWLAPPLDAGELIAGISIDTRTLKPGEAFVAIKGDTHDGHEHVAKAIELGAAMVVVSDRRKISDFGFAISDFVQANDSPSAIHGSHISARSSHSLSPNPKSEIPNPKSPILFVPDTVLALQQLASAWRDVLAQRGIKVIAVTGSSGKTTTRNLIHAALSATLRGTQSPKSFNNHLGVPLTLLAAGLDDRQSRDREGAVSGDCLSRDRQGAVGADGQACLMTSLADARGSDHAGKPEHFVVAEVGTNHPGEIATLAAILRPDVAVITNIGHAHIGYFGSQDAIAVEKSSLLKFLQPGGLAVVNGGQPWSADWRSLLPEGARMIEFRSGSDSGPLSLRERAGVRAGQHSTLGSKAAEHPASGHATAREPASPPTSPGFSFIATANDIHMDAAGLHFTVAATQYGEPLRIDLPMLGMHNAENVLVAIAVARELGVPDRAMAAALARTKGVAMRMELVRIGGDPRWDRGTDGGSPLQGEMERQGSPALTPALCRRERGAEPIQPIATPSRAANTGITVINDAYNANPDSMAAALATLVSLPARRRVAVLADMLEMGDAAADEHAKVGRLLAEQTGALAEQAQEPAEQAQEPAGIGLVILIGEAMGHAAGVLAGTPTPKAGHLVYVPRFTDDLPPRVAGLLRDGDVVLLKGSRGLQLERLLPAMRARFAAAASQPAPTEK